ncbi:hypothetical protein [Providencia vermicola]|uniref:hypothetical protein n=1 Tax=Providencia vermicola TaxID=333965 RepID=UPI00220C1A90|nr:hypothetical protein NFC79_14100 [Providencia stuartii]
MVNTHFLYLLGHLRLLEEQHSVTSLERTGVGLIGTYNQNLPYIQAVKLSAHHCELKAVCDIEPSLPSMSYYMCQKRKIEELMNNDDVNSIIMTSVCSDELLKFTIERAIDAGKDLLLNNIPNYKEPELTELLKQAKRNGVCIYYNPVLSFEDTFNQLKTSLAVKNKSETGLLRLSSHRMIEPENRLPFNTLRSVLTQKVELLLSLLPDLSLTETSVQYSHPFTKMENGDVLIINLRHKGGLLVSIELFFNTGNIADKISLKQCNHSYEVESKFIINKENQSINEKTSIVKQLDQFILKLHNDEKLFQKNHWLQANKLTDEIINQLTNNGFI